MKTFEEALNKTLTEPHVLEANLHAQAHEGLTSQRWIAEIMGLAESMQLRINRAVIDNLESPEHVIIATQGTMCVTLQTAFAWGVLVGMEMEKH